MADRELIAAILTAGMLPTLEIPRSRAHGSGRPVTETEGEDIQRAVGHAVGLYRSVLEGRALIRSRVFRNMIRRGNKEARFRGALAGRIFAAMACRRSTPPALARLPEYEAPRDETALPEP